jgi:hypothetical protein
MGPSSNSHLIISLLSCQPSLHLERLEKVLTERGLDVCYQIE